MKEGAIIPMYPEMLYDGQKPKDPVTLDVYPSGQTSFTLYEDDGSTQEYRNGAFSKSNITCNTSPEVVINVGKCEGNYTGKPLTRKYEFMVHTGTKPTSVLLNNVTMKESASASALNSANEGWYYSPTDKKGVVYVKTNPMPLDKDFEVRFGSVTGIHTSAEDLISIYPNPTAGHVYIQGLDQLDEVQISVYNIMGQQVMTKQALEKANSETILKLTEQTPGIYFIHFQTSEGLIVKKVVLEKN